MDIFCGKIMFPKCVELWHKTTFWGNGIKEEIILHKISLGVTEQKKPEGIMYTGKI